MSTKSKLSCLLISTYSGDKGLTKLVYSNILFTFQEFVAYDGARVVNLTTQWDWFI